MSGYFATACAVCFGDPQSLMTKGAFAGAAFLLGVIGFVLVVIAGTAIAWARRARKLAGSGS